jgi:RNase P subunit RPR2
MECQRAIDETQRDYCRLFVVLTCSRVTRHRFIRAIYFRDNDNPRVATLRQIVRENTIYIPRTAVRALSANCNFSLIPTVRARIGITRTHARTHAYCLQASLAQMS